MCARMAISKIIPSLLLNVIYVPRGFTARISKKQSVQGFGLLLQDLRAWTSVFARLECLSTARVTVSLANLGSGAEMTRHIHVLPIQVRDMVMRLKVTAHAMRAIGEIA